MAILGCRSPVLVIIITIIVPIRTLFKSVRIETKQCPENTTVFTVIY